MADNNLTLFQRLNRILGPDGTNKMSPSSQRFNLGKNELIKTDNKAEYDKAKLQAQQNKYLQGTWKKVENGLFQQAMNYETTRIASYTDFEAMEFYPEIAAALDIMMEESTTLNSKGRMLNVYSESKRVKGIIEDLLFNRLDLHTSLPMWVRNTVKYGDNFVYLNLDDKNGIIGGRQMPNYEMERHEGNLLNIITADTNDQNSNKVKFLWRGQNVELNSWQVAHFRILGDDRRLPYGTSLLEKARRIWKQLLISEDSMLVYRVTRAPERRVYKIYVGNIDDADVPAYVNDIANRFKRTPLIDPATGQMDLKFNQMANDQDYFIPVRSEDAPNPIDTLPGACLALDTRIPLLDGRTLELQEIIKEFNDGADMWVYSVDPNTGASTVGPITWAGVTRKDTQVLKITLDNGKSITATPDHKFVHRTKGFTEAQNLVVGDSLMPFYTDKQKIKTNTNGDYQRVWDSATNEWVFTHRLVKKTLSETGLIKDFIFDEKYKNEDKKIIHHKDHNRFNNNPSNLVNMNGGDHMKYHQSVIKETIWANPQENIEKTFDSNPVEKKNSMELYNHKIVAIEWLENTQDTGTITVDGEEEYQSTHTFALESGIYVKNSNLDQIADIEYLQRKLFTALRVPKSFLGFEEATGEGKNLALQDIRFSRTINRIQQSMLQELNKIVIIHLYMLGFEDDLDNFTITLNNPSTQAEMLKVEHDQVKITLYKDAVSDSGNGFGAMSMTRGKREILGWSDDEIKQDLLEQRMEKAAAAELANSAAVIKHTGMFDIVDRVYGDMELALKGGGGGEGEGGDDAGGGGGGGLGGSFGGGGMGGDDLDFGDEDGEDGGDDAAGLGGEEGGADDAGGLDDNAGGDAEEVPEAPAAGGENLAESVSRVQKILKENKTVIAKKLDERTKKYKNSFIDKLISNMQPDNKKTVENIKIYNKNLKVNESINTMVDDIDSLLNG